MAGWLGSFEDEINCPYRNSKIEVTIKEDRDQKSEIVVISGLRDGNANCPICNKLISDEDLNDV